MTPTRRPAPTATLIVLAVATGSFALMQSLITPVLSTIQTEFDTSQNTVTWVMTANLLSAAVFTPILGRLGDARGKKRVLVGILVALAVGSLLAAIAPSIGVLIVARVVQGAAGAVFPLSYAIIRDEFPKPRIAPAIGTISAVIAVGGGLGIVLAGPIVDGLGYAWLFLIPAIAVVAAALAAERLVPESPVSEGGRISWGAAVLLSGGLVSLLLALSRAPESGWTSASVIGLFLGALVLLVAWVATELRADEPLIDMRMMRLRGVWTTNLAAMLFGAGQFGLFVFVPQFVQTPASAGYGFGAGVAGAGALLGPMLVTMFGAGIVSGRVEERFGSKPQLVTASGLSVIAFTALALAHDEAWQVAAAGAVFGAGLGLALTSLTNLIVSNVPASQTGVASGMNANFRTIGGAIGAASMGSLVVANLQPSGVPVEAGYVNGFLLLAGFSVAAVVAALIVPSVRRVSRVAVDAAVAPSSALTKGSS
jgi:EmrB/QacA subfamily drug resistance transporter